MEVLQGLYNTSNNYQYNVSDTKQPLINEKPKSFNHEYDQVNEGWVNSSHDEHQQILWRNNIQHKQNQSNLSHNISQKLAQELSDHNKLQTHQNLNEQNKHEI